MKKALRLRSVSALVAAAALCSTSVAHAQGPAGAAMPNEGCSTPTVVKFPGCDLSTEIRDAGVGVTTVTTYGSAERHVAMPAIKDGMSGLASLYHRTFVFDASFTAWDGSGTALKGDGIPVPNLDVSVMASNPLDAASLEEAAYKVQPRPGTMPGLYLLQDEDENNVFYHYGGPLDSGANPQTTAIYQLASGGGGGGKLEAAFLPTSATYRYTNNLSGAELWYYTGITTPFVEIKHVDGSVARFDSFNPWNSAYTSGPGAGKRLWRVTQVRDPYDNVATYSYSSTQSPAALHRLTRIEFSSGLVQKFSYAPWSGWSGYDCFEVSYEQSGTPLTARTWGMVFSGVMGTFGGNHFGKRLHRTYSASRTMLPDPTAGQPHTIGSGYAVQGQIVTLFTYSTSLRTLTESQAVHTGTPFAAALSTSSGLSTVDTLVTTYVTSGVDAGRVSQQVLPLTQETRTCTYPSTGFRATDLLPGTLMAGIEVAEPANTTSPLSFTVKRYEYDRLSGRVYSVITTPANDAVGRPRAAHATTENSGIGALAGSEVEPERITIYNVFGNNCACQKPSEVRVISHRGGQDYTRTTKFEYYADTKLLQKRTEPNPQAGTGTFPAEVQWTYRYVQAKGTGLWGAWLPLEEVTPDGAWVYSYDDWLDRTDASSHGQIAGTAYRSISGVRQQSSLTGGTTSPTASVTETVHRNLSNSPGGLSVMGNVRGQVRRTIDGDGVATTFEYSTQGWLTAQNMYGSVTRTTFAYDSYGDLTGVTEHANSSTHQATATLTVMSGVGVSSGRSTTSGGLLRASETYFDRWGHAVVERKNNLSSTGSAPNKHGSTSSARPWVETQHHYQHRRLSEVYQDRKPLDEAAGAGQFLLTQLVYSPNGRLSHEINPNGSKTYHTFDGYGTAYRTWTTDPSGVIVVKGPKRFVSPFLEVVGAYKYTGVDHLWTVIERNNAGAITKITEPLTSAPSGYTPYAGVDFSTGGARHEFDIDVMGRVTKAQSFDNTVLLALRETRYDQLGRQIWQRDDALLRSSTSPVGQQYVAWKYTAGKATQLDWVEQSGSAPTTYEYSPGSGMLHLVRDGYLSGNYITYSYYAGSGYLSGIERVDLDPLSGTRTTTTAYDVDPFGRTTAIREGPVTQQLVHLYGYDSLGRVDQYTDPAGRVQKFLPDAMGRIVEHVRLGNGSDYIHNASVFEDTGFADGRTKVRRVDGLGNETITHSDFAGRPFIVQNPGGLTAPTASGKNQSMCLYAEYDDASRLQFLYDGEMGKTQFYRDGMGRVIQRGLVAVSDTPANPTKIAGWNTTDVFRRDALGRIASADYFGGGLMAADGTPPSLLWAVQPVTQDSIGRTHNERFFFAFAPGNPIDVQSTFTGGDPYRSRLDYLDNLGATSASAFSEPVRLDFGHDSIGRLADVQWDAAPGGGSAMHALAEYQWVGSLRRSRTVRYGTANHPQGRSNFSYDTYGRLTQIVDDVWASSSAFTTESKFDYEYDSASSLIRETYVKVGGGTGGGDRFAYDAYHRLARAWMGVNAATMATTTDPTSFDSSQMHEQLTYGLDPANNRGHCTSTTAATGQVDSDYVVQDLAHSQGPSNRYDRVSTGIVFEHDERGNLTYDGNFAYRYDYMNRLQEVWRVLPTLGMAQQGEKFAVFEEEAMEEVREDVKEDVPDLMQRIVREHMNPTFRARLKKNLRGGVLRILPTPHGGGGCPGFLREPAQMELYAIYVYDGYNRRTMSVPIGLIETQFHTWDGWQQVAQYSFGAITIGGGVVGVAYPNKQFVWGSQLDELIGYRRLNGSGVWENYYLMHSGQDTAAKLVDSGGNVVEQYEYDPYGRVNVFTGLSPTPSDRSAYGLPFLWKGIRQDVETGLFYMRNRYYSALSGRFLTPDPLGTWADAINNGNEYCYVGEHVLVLGDAMGLQGGGPLNRPYVPPATPPGAGAARDGQGSAASAAGSSGGEATLALMAPVVRAAPAAEGVFATIMRYNPLLWLLSLSGDTYQGPGYRPSPSPVPLPPAPTPRPSEPRPEPQPKPKPDGGGGRGGGPADDGDCKPRCAPCIPPVGTFAVDVHFYPSPPHRFGPGPLDVIAVPHSHLYVMMQSPPPVCICFWHKMFKHPFPGIPFPGFPPLTPPIGGGLL